MHLLTKKIISYFLIDEQTKSLKDDFYPYFFKINEIVQKEYQSFQDRNPLWNGEGVFLKPEYYQVICIKIPDVFESYDKLSIEQKFSKEVVTKDKNNFDLLKEQVDLIKIKVDEIYDDLYKNQQTAFMINHQHFHEQENVYKNTEEEQQSAEMIDIDFEFKEKVKTKNNSQQLIDAGKNIFEEFKKTQQGNFKDGFVEKPKTSEHYWHVQESSKKESIQEKSDNKMKYIVIGVIAASVILILSLS